MSEGRTQLVGMLDAARGRVARARAARALCVSGGLAGVAAGLGAPAVAISLVAASGLAALAARPPRREAARRLDRAAGLEGALECAHDHLERDDPMARAQRRRALGALRAAAPVRPAKRPHPAWLLLLSTWAWPVLAPPAAHPSGAPVAAGAASDEVAGGGAASEGDPGPAGADPKAGEARAEATEAASPPPDAGAAEGPEGGGGEATARAERGGVGTRAGERAGAGHTLVGVDRAAGVGPTLAVARGAGAGGPAAVGRGAPNAPPPAVGSPEDITDPARPYPPRYHAAVAAWFAHDRGRP